jgi:hypothetical protein
MKEIIFYGSPPPDVYLHILYSFLATIEYKGRREVPDIILYDISKEMSSYFRLDVLCQCETIVLQINIGGHLTLNISS